jgi:hypothetical protein
MAQLEQEADCVYAFMAFAHGRRFFTNSESRWMRHLRLCRRRMIPGTWYRWDPSSQWESPQYRPKAYVRDRRGNRVP